MKIFALVTTLLLSSFSYAGTIQITALNPQNAFVNHYFGQIPVNAFTTARYEIRNGGNTPVYFEGAAVYGQSFSALHYCQNGIPPYGSCTVELRFWPTFEGFQTGRVEMWFAYGNDVYFNVSGDAYRY